MPFLRASLLRLGPWRLLVFAPSVNAYGHLAIESLYALHWARRSKSALYLVRRLNAPNEALYHVTTGHVRNLHPNALLDAVAALAALTRTVQALIAGLRGWGRQLLRRSVGGAIGVVDQASFAPDRIRRPLKRRLKRLRAGTAPPPDPPATTYYLRRLIAEGLPTRFCNDYEHRGATYAAEVGIQAGARIVTVHAREAGYKRGREIHESKETTRDDSMRNVDIASYLPAIDLLVARGYTVVRLGDPSMDPLRRDGVVDLTQLESTKRQLLDVYCLLRSTFLLASESGPMGAALLTATPTLVTNATDPISSYPVRACDIYLLKHVRERNTGRFLSLEELVSEPSLRNVRNSSMFAYLDNDASEIESATEEILTLVEHCGEVPQTDEQLAFGRLATEAANALATRLKYVRKWGTDEGFLGAGRVGACLASRYLERGRSS